jgi:hypothetical protein
VFHKHDCAADWWAAVDSNHVPPRCLALSGLLLRVGRSTKLPVLSGLVLGWPRS